MATDDKSNEIPAAQELLQKMPPMHGSTFTFDAMHTQLKTANSVVEELGAELAIMQLKENQPGMLQYAQGLLGSSRLYTVETNDGDHGRIETRKIAVSAVRPADTIGLPYARQLICVEKKS